MGKKNSKKATAKKATAKKATAKKATAKKATAATAKKATAKKATAKKATAKKATAKKATAKTTTTMSDTRTPSEDEFRTKVVNQFLLDLGFSPNDVEIESPFTIRLGRVAHPRADVLVKKNERALFAIECKREDHDLTADDYRQAISYARLVQPDMPPYAILTNGKRTIILDTYLGEATEEIVIRDGMVVSPLSFEEAMRRRYEANKYLLTLSSHTLGVFISGEIEEQVRMHSAGAFRPPYSPETHIVRHDVCNLIVDFCRSDSALILPIVGPATSGKTSEIFSCIQSRLADPASEVLPLYIPLNYAGANFLPYVADNFGWALGQSMSEIRLIHDIDEIARSQRRSCVVYILDGADLAPEALKELRKEIANLLRRSGTLTCKHKVIVVSQEPTWLRLVVGQGVDLSSYCEKILRVDPLSEEQSMQHIEALEAHYTIKMPRSSGLPRLPVISHMLAQQMKTAGEDATNTQGVLGRYFNWQISKAEDDSALLRILVGFSTQQLEETDQYDLGKSLDLRDAVTVGFIVRAKDIHGRESYAFSDDWIHYFIVGFHIWKIDRSPVDKVKSLLAQAGERVEHARALEWLSFIMGEHEIWRAVSGLRPTHYLQCYKHATELLKALSVGEDACLWLAPSRGSLNSPWCSIITEVPGEIHWGEDPEVSLAGAPSEYIQRHDFSIFSRKPLAQHMADDAISALKEIQRWLPERGNYSGRNRLWLAQHSVFARLRHRLNGPLYDLADVALSLETPAHQGGVHLLQKIFDEALRITREVAGTEFLGIQDVMPTHVRYEIAVDSRGRETASEYYTNSDASGAEVLIAKHGEIDHWWQQRDDVLFTRVRRYSTSNRLFYILGIPSYDATWAEVARLGALKEINAAGNVAARWLADGISSAVLVRPRREMSEAKSRILAHLGAAGIVDQPEEELQVIESVLRALREADRISTWMRTENGFVVDGYWSVRPLRQGEAFVWIVAVPERANSVKVTIRQGSDEYAAVVSRAELKYALADLLDRFIGFPSPRQSKDE